MKQKIVQTLTATAAVLVLTVAWAEPPGEAIEQADAAPVDAAPADAGAPSKDAAHKFSDGMQIPVDGSSLEAFDQSLEKIKKQATEAEFTTLENALDYLLVYDLAAKRNRTKLAANLDGLTGEQIVDKVEWRKGEKFRNR